MQDSLKSSSYQQLEQKSKYTNMFLRWFLYFILILLLLILFSTLRDGCYFVKDNGRDPSRNTFKLAKRIKFESWAVAWGGRGYGAGDTF